MAQYDYVLFDADNTLFDFHAAEHAALEATLAHWGLPGGDAVHARYQSINAALWAAHERGEVARDALVVERFLTLLSDLDAVGDGPRMNAYYLARLGEDATLLPGAEALCQALASRFTLAIVTNGVGAVQRSRMARSPLGALFPHLFISEDLGAQKPDRAFFDQVLLALNITDPSRAILVGDSLSADIRGAANVGLPSIWYNPKNLPLPAENCPTYQAADFPSIAALLLD